MYCPALRATHSDIRDGGTHLSRSPLLRPSLRRDRQTLNGSNDDASNCTWRPGIPENLAFPVNAMRPIAMD